MVIGVTISGNHDADDIVFNLSTHVLTTDEFYVLNKGLSFVPSRESNYQEAVMDLMLFCRGVALKNMFGNNVVQKSVLRQPSTFVPPLTPSLQLFVNACEKDLLDYFHKGHTHRYHNLTSAQRQALHDLSENREIVIKMADKGGAIVVMDTTFYNNKLTHILSDSCTYVPMNPLMVKHLIDKVHQTLEQLLNDMVISKELYNFLKVEGVVTPLLKGLPKIHKSLTDPPLRPIVSGRKWVTENASIWLEITLRPYVEKMDNILLDTGGFLKALGEIDRATPKVCHLIVTLDVQSLFTVINNDYGILAIRTPLKDNGATDHNITQIITMLNLEQPQLSWTDDLPLCHLSGVGSSPNCAYSADGKGKEERAYEDGWLKFRTENDCFLYGVVNGYGGKRVADLVAQRLPAELLLGQLNANHSDADVQRVLLQAFDVVERSCLESIDDGIAEKTNLQSQLPESALRHQLASQFQKIVERLNVVEQEILGGAMAIVALILSNRLFIANVGTNRALLCKSTVDGLQVTQLSIDHTTDNEDELFRLSQLGLDAGRIKQVGAIGGQDSTRRIGDYKMKYEYSDIELLSAAKSKPITAEPEIHGGLPLDGVTGFLLLMSEGFYKALDSAHGPGQANQEIAAMVATEFAKQTTLDEVAQAVVDRVKRIHRDTFVSGAERSRFCNKHEDMTLLVRNFGYLLGEMSQCTLTPTQGGRIYPVSVPYYNNQSTSKTSVTLSLVMPSQSPMVNGSHSSCTLDEVTPTLTNQSPTATLQSTNTHTQSSSSSSDGGLFRHRPPHSLQPDEDGKVEPYVDFSEFYRLWNMDHGDQTTPVIAQ
ncbi:TGF-beta-activated kinase 1 and MAP3K7-binding protein 1 [Protopterus annectens]|uniref:TGF-beta-activated kinase 1 and MAP3K7-binding protein 1 n=1 Tax=Protopterus annectens TaxID=7888 RepID=UPI001CFA23AC|nr:TGF-beta-activated kinase 1 and MAP3K7-binding protein 1 [Protopterus annectens]